MAMSHRSQRFYDVAPEVAFSALRGIVRSRGFTVQVEDPRLNLLEVKTGVSARSWGERLHITAGPAAGGRGSVVEVDSRSTLALVDWGRNRDNVEGILGDLVRAL